MIEKIYALSEKIDAKVIRAGIAISVFTSSIVDTGVAYAGDLGFLEGSKGDNGTFNQITTTAEQTGYSFYKLFMVICIIGLAVSGIACGAAIGITHNTNKKSEKKSHLIDICIGALVVFGILTLLGLVKGVADKITV